MDKPTLTKYLKRSAQEAGFSYVGVSKAGFLAEEAPRLENWLKAGKHGEMSYMGNYFDKRLDTTLLVEGSKSVISLLYNYHTPKKQTDPEAPKLSSYAYGQDYHFVIKAKLKELLEDWQTRVGDFDNRVFVDSAPVMERAWAAKSGLGWIGKHTLLINKQKGSNFFLAEVICDLELEYDGPIKDYCGTCTACIDACPTDAITPYDVDASKCISYLTIELKDSIPTEFKGKMDNWMFGCDICQDVCPWNRFAETHNESAFEPHPDLLDMTKKDWENLQQETFQKVFMKSAVKRTKFSGLSQNIKFLKGGDD